MSEEIKELLFLLHNDRLTEAGKRKLEKEIERQKEVINGMIDNEEKYCLEIERLYSIIKEVREYIEKHLEREYFDYDILEANTIYNRDLYKVLEILDKEN